MVDQRTLFVDSAALGRLRLDAIQPSGFRALEGDLSREWTFAGVLNELTLSCRYEAAYQPVGIDDAPV